MLQGVGAIALIICKMLELILNKLVNKGNNLRHSIDVVNT